MASRPLRVLLPIMELELPSAARRHAAAIGTFANRRNRTLDKLPATWPLEERGGCHAAAGQTLLCRRADPMGFLRTLLARPANERACVVIPVGYPADGAMVPGHERKPLDLVFVRR